MIARRRATLTVGMLAALLLLCGLAVPLAGAAGNERTGASSAERTGTSSVNHPAGTRPTVRACSSYPRPGSIAPADTRLPGWLTRRYSVLRAARRRGDGVSSTQLSSSLTAADLVLSHARYLGRAADGGRVYLIPAEHLLAFPLAPARCLPAAERGLEAQLHPQLVKQYRHWALCLVVLHSDSTSPTCGAANANPGSLLFAPGTPGFGLVPDGVPAVTVSYLSAPARTVDTHRNVFLINDSRQAAAPCAVQWLSGADDVTKTIAGCDYVPLLEAPLTGYRSYVQSTLGTLAAQVNALAAAISAGNLAGAESDWLTAHETWLDIGQDDAAYSAYGNLGNALDGTAAGLPGGPADPDFTGFHKVEWDLFTNHDLATAAADMPQLQDALTQIVDTSPASAFPASANGIAAWILRPHEILEDAIRDTLSGDDDNGSASGIASITADITATREDLTLLEPVLGPLAPQLIPRAQAELSTLESACDASQVNGTWVAVSALPERQREQIDADADAAAETLSLVPGTLTSIGHAAATS